MIQHAVDVVHEIVCVRDWFHILLSLLWLPLSLWGYIACEPSKWVLALDLVSIHISHCFVCSAERNQCDTMRSYSLLINSVVMDGEDVIFINQPMFSSKYLDRVATSSLNHFSLKPSQFVTWFVISREWMFR